LQPWVYIVLVGAVAIVYALRLPARNKDNSAEKQSLKETEAALELYMADIERENDKMLELVSSIKQQSQNNRAALQEEIQGLREQVTELQKTTMLLEARLTAEEKGLLQLTASVAANVSGNRAAEAQSAAQASPAEAPPEPKAKPVSSIKLRYPRLFELHEEGKSIDSIAKTAGLQRGEVQLILQLAKQEESV
jgi:septal ring factor EnvC (AmiA/AmiB activator)